MIVVDCMEPRIPLGYIKPGNEPHVLMYGPVDT